MRPRRSGRIAAGTVRSAPRDGARRSDRHRWVGVGQAMGVGRAAHVRICVGALALTTASAALAELPEATAAHPAREIHSVAALAVFGGLVVFAVILSLLHLYERGRWTRRERELAAALDVLRGAHDRAEMLLNAERQIIVTWDRRSEPVVEGDISLAIFGERPTSGY